MAHLFRQPLFQLHLLNLHLVFRLHHPHTHAQSLYHGPTVPADAPPPQRLFWVCKLNNRITTCFGCRGKFTRSAGRGVPVPPLDLILKCNESRQYYGKDGNEKENSNTYYHPNLSCIRNKHPEFVHGDIRIAPSS